MGIPPSTLSGWMIQYKNNPSRSIESSFQPSEAELELKRLRKQKKDLQEKNETLNKWYLLREEPKINQFLFIRDHASEFKIVKMCRVLMISKSGYNASNNSGKSAKYQENHTFKKILS